MSRCEPITSVHDSKGEVGGHDEVGALVGPADDLEEQFGSHLGERDIGARLNRTTSNAMEVTALIGQMFNQLYAAGKEYRSTSVVLGRLESDSRQQYDLFDDQVQIERMRELGCVVEQINRRYGKHRIFLGTGLGLGSVEMNERDEPCWRKLNLLAGETKRRRIRIPRLDLKV